ncbi:MAG: SulP family inorganic anion transporter [Magnetococcales bacterium]|nr:SulP family inorganic anion transporter [Magnetococcales bacterium]
MKFRRIVPHWLKTTNRKTLLQDLMSGMTGAVVVLPQGVAFAAIAGLPPEFGLYTAIVPAIVAALFGSSLHLVSGPTTAISIVVFSTLAPMADPGSQEFIILALSLSFMAGFFQLAMGLARLGGLISFVSHSVVVGFTSGAAILIATSQLKHLFGIKLPSGESFIHTWIDLYHALPDMNHVVLLVGLVTLISAVTIKRFFPKWPEMLIAMLIGSLLAQTFDASVHQITVVGSLPAVLPPISMPDFSFGTIRTLSSGALAIAILGLLEAVSIARSIATKSGQTINGNKEFIGQGMSNIVGSFFSAYPASGSFTRTGVNYRAGAKTPLSAVFAALLLAAILLLVAPLAAHLPIAVMAGIILHVAYNLIDIHHIRTILRAARFEASVMIVTFLATLFLELEFAVYVGVMLSLVLYLNRTSKPKILSRVPNPLSPWRMFITKKGLTECPQLKILRIDGSLYFGSVASVESVLRRTREKYPEQKNLLIVCTGVNFSDLAGAALLLHESQRRRVAGGDMFLHGLKDQIMDILEKCEYLTTIGRDHIFQTKHDAIENILAHYLEPEICSNCPHEVFLECASRHAPSEPVT